MADDLARVVELVDRADLKSAAERHGGSSPSAGTEQRVCKRCGDPKELRLFKLKKNGSRSHTCTKCWSSAWWKSAKGRLNARARSKFREDPVWAILKEAKAFDKKRGFAHDLTREFVENAISQGCCYCGETTLRMTLDRKDNGSGHDMSNVVPACIRCNYARRDMPYEAWLHIAVAFREARERGLFGTWTGRARKPGVVE